MVGIDLVVCSATAVNSCLPWLASGGTGCASCTSAARVPCPHVHACRGFKALKQVVKLHYRLNQKDKMLASYRWALSGASTVASSMCLHTAASHVTQPAVWLFLASCCQSDVSPQHYMALVHQASSHKGW